MKKIITISDAKEFLATWAVLFIIFCTCHIVCFAKSYEQAAPNVWFVSKAGLDANSGRTWTEAKLTIGAAVTASTLGDIINIANGTYAEAVDLTGKSNMLIGGHPRFTIIAPATGTAITADSNSYIYNVTAYAAAGTAAGGIVATSKIGVVIEDCIAICDSADGATDGIKIGSSTDCRITRTMAKAVYDGIVITSATNLLIDGLISKTTGSGIDVEVRGILEGSAGKNIIVRNSAFYAARTSNNDYPAVGGLIKSGIWENCAFYASTATSCDGDANGCMMSGGNLIGSHCEATAKSGKTGTKLFPQNSSPALVANTWYYPPLNDAAYSLFFSLDMGQINIKYLDGNDMNSVLNSSGEVAVRDMNDPTFNCEGGSSGLR